MVAMARSKWPEKTILSDDQADALWILDLAKSELTPSPAERAVT
jgi:hypothetical protein